MDDTNRILRKPRRLRAPSLGATLVVATLCALVLAWLSEATHQRIETALTHVRAARDVRSAVHTLQHALLQAESSQRGYLITGDRQYLEPFSASVAQVNRQLDALDLLAPRTLGMPEAVAKFRGALIKKLDEMALTIRLRSENRAQAMDYVISTDVGLEQMRVLRAQGDALANAADAEVRRESTRVDRLINQSRLILAVGILALLAAFSLFVVQARALRRLELRRKQELQVERDTLETRVRERTARLAELATHLQHAVENERAHLARELHDELGALLTAAKLDIARLKSRLPAGGGDVGERLRHLNETLNQGIALKRRIIEHLRPSALDHLGLVEALNILVAEFAQQSGIAVHAALEPVNLDADNELTLYRVAQEALTNIGKYAQAREVTITLKSHADATEIAVVDDGIGFDPTQQKVAAHGLAGMSHRLHASGGRLEVDSAPGRGTRLTGHIPRGRV